ncbi:hypothetical protein AAHN97_06755 [Chitinophaga niabensis]|uniref:hypothetical protein n=1 Tax=Chitinophaga niabensis TaxID=536979 RepID=UPI0031BB8073
MLKQLSISLIVLFTIGCNKNNDNKISCSDVIRIEVSTTPSDSCIPVGAIRIIKPIGNDHQYRINNGPYQYSPDFQSLVAGKYTIVVKNGMGCEKADTVVIPSTIAGPLFSKVKQVLATYCISCHSGNNPQAGHDWSKTCDILLKWERIKARAVEGIPSPMPTSGLIPQVERDKITAWIDAGHRYID